MYCRTILSHRHLTTLAAILFGLIATPAIARDSNSLMDISTDGRLLAYPDQDGGIQVGDVSTGEIVAQLKGHPKAAERVSFSPDGTRLCLLYTSPSPRDS